MPAFACLRGFKKGKQTNNAKSADSKRDLLMTSSKTSATSMGFLSFSEIFYSLITLQRLATLQCMSNQHALTVSDIFNYWLILQNIHTIKIIANLVIHQTLSLTL